MLLRRGSSRSLCPGEWGYWYTTSWGRGHWFFSALAAYVEAWASFFPNVSRCFMMNTSHEMLDLFISALWCEVLICFNLLTDIAEVTGTWPWIQSWCQRKCEGLQWFTRSFSLDNVGYVFWCVSEDKKMSAILLVVLQDQPIKAPLLSQKAWRVKRNHQLKLRMQMFQKVGSQDLNRKFQDCLDNSKALGLMEGLHAINKAEQGCCALDRGGDFAFVFDRSVCA